MREILGCVWLEQRLYTLDAMKPGMLGQAAYTHVTKRCSTFLQGRKRSLPGQIIIMIANTYQALLCARHCCKRVHVLTYLIFTTTSWGLVELSLSFYREKKLRLRKGRHLLESHTELVAFSTDGEGKWNQFIEYQHQKKKQRSKILAGICFHSKRSQKLTPGSVTLSSLPTL